jgi:hypothetical protein
LEAWLPKGPPARESARPKIGEVITPTGIPSLTLLKILRAEIPSVQL